MLFPGNYNLHKKSKIQFLPGFDLKKLLEYMIFKYFFAFF